MVLLVAPPSQSHSSGLIFVPGDYELRFALALQTDIFTACPIQTAAAPHAHPPKAC
jgi:hypothetical protein